MEGLHSDPGRLGAYADAFLSLKFKPFGSRLAAWGFIFAAAMQAHDNLRCRGRPLQTLLPKHHHKEDPSSLGANEHPSEFEATPAIATCHALQTPQPADDLLQGHHCHSSCVPNKAQHISFCRMSAATLLFGQAGTVCRLGFGPAAANHVAMACRHLASAGARVGWQLGIAWLLPPCGCEAGGLRASQATARIALAMSLQGSITKKLAIHLAPNLRVDCVKLKRLSRSSLRVWGDLCYSNLPQDTPGRGPCANESLNRHVLSPLGSSTPSIPTSRHRQYVG